MATGTLGPGGAADPAEVIAALTRSVADFPQPGVVFRDLTPVLADDHGFAVVTEALARHVESADLIAGVDARGFLLGGAVAHRLGVGVLAVRKAGKLPPPVHSRSYDLEYGAAALEIPAEGVRLAGRRVAIIDDVLATGGTLAACRDLLSAAGAVPMTAAVVVELDALGGRQRLAGLPVHSLQRV
ncbi:MAG: adenine phosphoribosyltransferase [Mycobacterium sp.]|nr:adenine phosphoribosyltransferase [Mycobacterium sp.]